MTAVHVPVCKHAIGVLTVRTATSCGQPVGTWLNNLLSGCHGYFWSQQAVLLSWALGHTTCCMRLCRRLFSGSRYASEQVRADLLPPSKHAYCFCYLQPTFVSYLCTGNHDVALACNSTAASSGADMRQPFCRAGIRAPACRPTSRPRWRSSSGSWSEKPHRRHSHQSTQR
jgi:hypothetical protein